MLASPEVERMAKLKVVYSTIDKMVDNAVLSLPKLTQEIFRKFNDDGKTPVEISEEYGIDLSDVELHIKKGYDRYDQAGVERKILKMYLMDEMPYEKISSELNIKLNTLKVMIMRAKEKLIKSINLKMAVIEVSGVYTLDQLNLDDWYNTCPDSQ
jgi:DNA-directed RNA polymerase specialized sigma24 family protein